MRFYFNARIAQREREKEMTVFNLIYFSTEDLDILSL